MLRVPGLPSSTTYRYILYLLEEDGCALYDKFAALDITNAERVKLDNGRVESILFTGHNCCIELHRKGVYERFDDSYNQARVEEYRTEGVPI